MEDPKERMPFPVRREGVLSEEFEDGLVLCHPATEQVVYLNATGAAIWEMCDGGTDPEDMARELISLFPQEDEEKVRREVAAFLADLRSRGFLL